MEHHSCKSIGQVAALGRRRVKNNQHFVWATVGEPGSGKSEFNIQFAKDLQGDWPDVDTQIAFRPKDRMPMARALGRFKVILDDEATGEGGNKRRAMGGANVDSSMDMDACRGRNQYVGFACPSIKRLDDAITDHVMWLFVIAQNHSLKAFEMVKYGPPTDRRIKPRFRFKVPKVPFLGDVNPALRDEYLEAKENHMRGHSTDDAQVAIQLQAKAGSSLLRVLGPVP